MLELLEIYMNLVERQDDVITQLNKIIKRQAMDLAHLQNLIGVEIDDEFQNNADIVKKVMQKYNSIKV